MHFYISIILAAMAVVLLFSPETIIQKDTQNPQLKMIRDYSMVFGLGCAGLAYYFYSNIQQHRDTASTSTETTTEMSQLPTYEEATSEAA
jgi:cytosine/uracil/thiamine/allantoin permease